MVSFLKENKWKLIGQKNKIAVIVKNTKGLENIFLAIFIFIFFKIMESLI